VSDSDIPAIPNVPEALREAAQLGKLIPFVGAGASCLAGCPNWTEFANGVLGHFIEQGKFSYAQLAQIESLAPRVKLSIALELRDELGVRLDFRTLFHPRAGAQHPKGRRLYGSLSRIGKTFVTTNL
jgi:hypothetical protein